MWLPRGRASPRRANLPRPCSLLDGRAGHQGARRIDKPLLLPDRTDRTATLTVSYPRGTHMLNFRQCLGAAPKRCADSGNWGERHDT